MTHRALVDSGVWIAAFNKKDIHHDTSKEIMKAILEGSPGNAVVTDYIFDEVVTYIRKKISPEASSSVSRAMIDSRKISFLHLDEESFMPTFHVFQRYEKLSFTDASIVVVMRNQGITTLYSFDSGFDGIRGIDRLDAAL